MEHIKLFEDHSHGGYSIKQGDSFYVVWTFFSPDGSQFKSKPTKTDFKHFVNVIQGSVDKSSTYKEIGGIFQTETAAKEFYDSLEMREEEN